MVEPRDTGDIAEVPEDERLDLDELEDSGGDDGDLSDVFANPGEVVE